MGDGQQETGVRGLTTQRVSEFEVWAASRTSCCEQSPHSPSVKRAAWSLQLWAGPLAVLPCAPGAPPCLQFSNPHIARFLWRLTSLREGSVEGPSEHREVNSTDMGQAVQSRREGA